MRKIGKLSNKTQFETFCYYLYSLGIETHISEDENDYNIWIVRDNHLKESQEYLKQFLENPNKAQYKQMAEEGKQKEIIDQKKAAEKAKKEKFIDARLELFQQSKLNYNSISFVLIAISVLIFVFKISSQNNILYYWLSYSEDHLSNYMGIKSFAEISSGQVWRLITPIFLHHDILHLAFNMYWIYRLSTDVEKQLGASQFCIFIIFIAILSNTAFYLAAGPRFGGMSGVIYGLIAFQWMQDSSYSRSYTQTDPSLYKFFTFWYVFCWLLTVIGFFRVANTVHGVGALAGLLFSLGITVLKNKKEGINNIRFNSHTMQTMTIIALLIFGGILTDYLCYYR